MTGHEQKSSVASCIEFCTTDDVIIIAEITSIKYVASGNWGCYLIAFSDSYIHSFLFLCSWYSVGVEGEHFKNSVNFFTPVVCFFKNL